MARSTSTSTTEARGVWSTSEHERFLQAIAMYPQGPWHLITAHVGTRSTKQVQTHAQKYQHKLLRHQRGLRKWKTKSKRPEHRVDATTIDRFAAQGKVVGPSPSVRRPRKLSEESSEFSDDSTMTDFETQADAIEPLPFTTAPHDRDGVRAASDADDRLLNEALEAILAWRPSLESNSVCV